jgi:indole-3-acetate monooxygenase
MNRSEAGQRTAAQGPPPGQPDAAHPLDAAQIRDGARRLLVEIEANADEAASLRRMPIEMVAKLRAAGVFRMAMPRARGGPEMSPRQQVEIIEMLALADPAVGWCVRAGALGGLLSAHLTDGAASELFPSLDTVTAGDFALTGHAERTRGGYRVSGRWGFASGCTHADVIFVQCQVFDGETPAARRFDKRAPIETRILMAPAGAWQILDTWYTTGLAGSGSHDFTAHDLYIPAEHTFSMSDVPRRSEALYASDALFPAVLPGVPLGLARRAIESLRALVEPTSSGDSAPRSSIYAAPSVRSALAQAEAILGAARAYTYETLDAAWLQLQSGAELTKHLRVALALSRLYAFRAGREVAQLMFNAAGAAAVYARSPLDRLLRDAITISQQTNAQDGCFERIGSAMLDEDPLRFA